MKSDNPNFTQFHNEIGNMTVLPVASENYHRPYSTKMHKYGHWPLASSHTYRDVCLFVTI